jgi:7,8-dihydro-6-hydroxymethylpterin dimethyltransferase
MDSIPLSPDMGDVMEDSNRNETESLCPVCLNRIRAKRLQDGDDTFMLKECPEHGVFRTILWRGKPPMDLWQRAKAIAHPDLYYSSAEKGCPFDCGLCEAHLQLPCSVLIEITDRCNLHCPICFADSGHSNSKDPSIEDISNRLGRAIAAVGPSNLQLSGGEPTLRNDLPDIIKTACYQGYSFIQVNSNGIRLAEEKDYAKILRDAGLSSVFLQFDGVTDETYLSLRGKALFEHKLQAIKNCGDAGLGVVLVPTLVRNVNTDEIGSIINQALGFAPIVRGVHFQPVSYFGRFPKHDGDEGRFTLPELMRSIEDQTGGLFKVSDFSPPGCEHSHCSFHTTCILTPDKGVRVMCASEQGTCCSTGPGEGGVKKTVETVSRRWVLPAPVPVLNRLPTSARDSTGSGDLDTMVEGPLDLEDFLLNAPTRTFTISAMAFQDADTLDLERLKGCCISVISPDGRLIPFCAYNLTSRDGKGLYRHRNGASPQ